MRFIARRGKVLASYLAAAVALVAVPTAAAHFVYSSGTYVRGPICVGGGSGIAEGPPQVITEGWTQSFGQGVCLTAKSMPAYHLSLRRQLYHWNGSAWALCANSGWQSNESPTSYKSIWRQWAQMPCGPGWYDHYGDAWAYHNGQWLGGGRWAGNHYF